MLVARQTFLRQSVASCDALTLAAALVLSYWLRGPAVRADIGPFSNYFWMLWVILPAWFTSLWFAGLYTSGTYGRLTSLVAAVIRAQIGASLIMLSSMYMTKSVEVSRVLTQLFILTSFCAMLLQKLALYAILARHRQRTSFHRSRVLLVGGACEAARYIDLMDRHTSMTAEIVGVLTPSDELSAPPVRPEILGRLPDLVTILSAKVVDEVVVLTRLWPALMERIAAACAVRGVVMRLLMDVPSASVGAWRADDCGDGIFFLSLTAVPQDVISLVIKRAVDIVGAVAGLVACLLAYALYGRRLKRETGASAIFRQYRVGLNGRRFVLYKFRTMHRDAENRLSELRALTKSDAGTRCSSWSVIRA